VRGDFESAVSVFLTKTSSQEHPESRKARERLQETQNFAEALSSFPKGLRYERWMLHHLSKHRNDHSGAFRKLPLRLVRLFVQAYQSFLFNRVLSKRIQQGIPLDEARIGDYVVSSDIYGLPTKKPETVTAESIQRINEALKNGKMHNALPLIGYRQPLSDGIQGEIEREVLEDENASPKDFYVPLMPEIGSSGSLRTSLTPLLDLSVEEITKDPANPDKLKLRLSFGLRRGSYATTFLRELMKPKNVIKAGF
jgi:tRNA pseudouridine13 synthase